jgi:DNA polymerase I
VGYNAPLMPATNETSSSNEPKGRKTLLLVDGNNLVYRSFFAIPPLATRRGVPTNAVLGFANVLRKILSDETPSFAAVTFDAGGRTFRHERFQAYKANRPPTPDDLKQQIPYTRALCDALGLSVLEVRGIEADDLMGTLARRAVEAGYRVDIVSSDKDLLQLVGNDVTVIHPVKYDRLDVEGVREKFGVPPEQVVDVLALMGDSIDNIPGVPGIGEKGARKLVHEWGSLEAILAHAAEVKNKRQREALEEHREQARLSKELVTISCDLDLDLKLEDLQYRGPNQERAYQLFEELEFTSLLKDYLPREEVDVSATYDAIETDRTLGEFLDRARKRGRLALWLELERGPDRFDPWSEHLAGVGLALEKGEGVFVSPKGVLDEASLLSRLSPLVADPRVAKVGHEIKRAVTFFEARGSRFAGIGCDTALAAYVLNPTRRSQDLSDLSLEFLQRPLTPEAELGGAQGVLPGMEAASSDQSATRARGYAERAERMLRLSDLMDERIEDEELERVYRELELPLIEVLSSMELAGIAIDREEFQKMSSELALELERLTAEIYELAGVEFNINSPRQLAEILFDKMNLPSFKKTTKQRVASTRVDVLEELAASFPFPRKVLDYRSLAKLKGTYVDALPTLVNPKTGRIHTTFNQTVTATGRLSSSDPNLQNIPIRTELGRRLRRAFVAAPGFQLLSADYSQIELRVLAHLSKDEALIEAFRAGEDIHDRTARQVFGDAALSDSEKRRRAKIINFSIIYGKTAFTLGKEFGVPTREAQAFIDAYLDRYPRVRVLLDEIVRDTRRTGKVRTLFGRQRYVPEIGSRNRNTRSAAERVAVNTPVQGTAADLIKKAMIDLHRNLRDEKLRARLLLQVHDELVLEVPDEELERAAKVVRETMEGVYPLEVPLKADIKSGRSWEH